MVIPHNNPELGTRYAATMHTQFDDELYPKGITVCFSPDGIHWKLHFPPVIPLDGDCHAISWDPGTKCFLLTTRSSQHGNLCSRWGHPWKRHIALAKSRDLLHWTPTQTILEVDENDPEDAQIYMMLVIPYGHLYLGQMLMFYTHEMTLDNQWAVSRDLVNWKRLEYKPCLKLGPEGSWDSKHVTLSKNLPHPEGNLLRFWYGGASAPHYQAGYGALGTATLRRDGFACYEAGDEEGILTTIPLEARKCWIALNVDAADGEVLVEVLDKSGTPVEGFRREDCVPIRGDWIRALVQFRTAGSTETTNRFVFGSGEFRFRFYLKRARLYAFKANGVSPLWPKEEQ